MGDPEKAAGRWGGQVRIENLKGIQERIQHWTRDQVWGMEALNPTTNPYNFLKKGRDTLIGDEKGTRAVFSQSI